MLVLLSAAGRGPGALQTVGASAWRVGLVLAGELGAGAAVAAWITHRRVRALTSAPALGSLPRDHPRAPVTPGPARLVVLVSGSGTNLQALLDAWADPAYGARSSPSGADRTGHGPVRPSPGVPTFELPFARLRRPEPWDTALTAPVARPTSPT